MSDKCPLNLDKETFCPLCDFAKEGLCDYPYRHGMTLGEMRELRNEKNTTEKD